MKPSTTSALSLVALLLTGCATKPAPTSADIGNSHASPGAEYAGPAPSPETIDDADALSSLQRAFTQTAGDTVFFDFDSYALNQDSRRQLDHQVAWLSAHPDVKITIAGNCDERGTRTYNMALGARRSNAVRDYFVARGLHPARLKTVSYGKERPLETAANEAAWARNRNARSVLIGLAWR